MLCIIHRCLFYQRKIEKIAIDSEHLQHYRAVINRLMHLQEQTSMLLSIAWIYHGYYATFHANYRYLVMLMPSIFESEHSSDHNTIDFNPYQS